MLELTERSNLLLEAALPLLICATRIQRFTLSRDNDKDKLLQYLSDNINLFEEKVKLIDYSIAMVNAARCSLCFLLDETIINSQKTSTIKWDSYKLLYFFMGEKSDGRNFFNILDDAVKNPLPNLDLLELLYVCLSLCAEGKYNVQKQSKIAEIIKQYRGEKKYNLLVQYNISSKLPEVNLLKKRINLGKIAVVGLVVVIGYFIYLHWNAILEQQLYTVKEMLNFKF